MTRCHLNKQSLGKRKTNHAFSGRLGTVKFAFLSFSRCYRDKPNLHYHGKVERVGHAQIWVSIAEVSLEAGNRRIPPASSQVIDAYYFDKLNLVSQFSGEACPLNPRKENSPYGSLSCHSLLFHKTSRFTIKLIETSACHSKLHLTMQVKNTQV